MSSLIVEREQSADSRWELKRQRLIHLVRRLCLLQGERFQLASGVDSRYYFNMKPAMFNPEGSHLVSEFMLREARKARADLIGGLEMGAVPIIACVAQLSFSDGGRLIGGFFVRKAVKTHGTRSLIEGASDNDTFAGKRTIIVDDVTTTGDSVLQAVDAARTAGAIVSVVATVVDRLEGAEANLASHGLHLIAITTARDYGIAR